MKLICERLRIFFHYRDLMKHLVMKDLKLKYRRSVLGYLWSVLNPLLIMIVMTIVFSSMFKRSIENFPVYLFTGLICILSGHGTFSGAGECIFQRYSVYL